MFLLYNSEKREVFTKDNHHLDFILEDWRFLYLCFEGNCPIKAVSCLQCKGDFISKIKYILWLTSLSVLAQDYTLGRGSEIVEIVWVRAMHFNDGNCVRFRGQLHSSSSAWCTSIVALFRVKWSTLNIRDHNKTRIAPSSSFVVIVMIIMSWIMKTPNDCCLTCWTHSSFFTRFLLLTADQL